VFFFFLSCANFRPGLHAQANPDDEDKIELSKHLISLLRRAANALYRTKTAAAASPLSATFRAFALAVVNHWLANFTLFCASQSGSKWNVYVTEAKESQLSDLNSDSERPPKELFSPRAFYEVPVDLTNAEQALKGTKDMERIMEYLRNTMRSAFEAGLQAADKAKEEHI
jgi:hypothetical protein